MDKQIFEDPELEHIEGSEIAAAVDITVEGTDKIVRPIYINQDEQVLALTLEDAIRLNRFLKKAIIFVKDYNNKKLQ